MFDNTTNNNQPPVEDIFSQVAQEPSIVNNKISPLKPLNETMPSLDSGVMPVEEGSIWQGKWIIIIIIVLVLAIVAMFGVWFWKKSATPNTAVKPAAVVPIVNDNPANTNVNNPNTPPPVDNLPTDTDGDGLSDVQENQLGTDINNTDTDADGLFDGEEYKIYKTDLLKSDTDGDGFTDGQEVHNGYNPNGPGKLLELPNNQ